MSEQPILARYEGEGQWRAVSSTWAVRADTDYVIGEVYNMVPSYDRSRASHNHYFALITEAWQTLPDDLFAEYSSPDMLRKKMLVRCGYADERTHVCASKAEAQRLAAFIKPMDEYAVVIAREAVVRVYTARSQSVKAMGKQAFEESKGKVLDAIARLLGIEADHLGRAA